MNVYKPTVKVSIGEKFIGYFANKQQFDEVYNTLVAEKEQINTDVKVYLESDPTFATSYVRDSLIADQNVYTNLRAELKTEYTIYNVAVNGQKAMTFNTSDEANKYAASLKTEVAKLNVDVTPEKVAETGEITTIERADSIVRDIVSRNKEVVTPNTKNVIKKYTPTKTVGTTANVAVSAEVANNALAQGGIWPTSSRYISSPFGWRGSSMHTGTDIAGKSGDPIYAYKDGVVTFSGWNASGYGYLVIINHGNGFSTWYAHNSKIIVSAGETVKQGQQISYMGTTGYSTGNHLHFETRINGTPVNSYNYIAAYK
ncbi:MAG: M23 family metallopeptidase [Clostridia bacterium]|nr:M23 family metallopeptidase [Clostridia bacterium]